MSLNTVSKIPNWDLSAVQVLPRQLIPWLEENGSNQQAIESEKEKIVAIVEMLAQKQILTGKQARQIEQHAGGIFPSKFTLSNGKNSKQISTFVLQTLSQKIPFFRPVISGSYKESQERTLHIEASDAAFEAFTDYLITKKFDSVIDLSNLEESLLSKFDQMLDFYGINERQRQYFDLSIKFTQALRDKDGQAIQNCFHQLCLLKPCSVFIECNEFNKLSVEWDNISHKSLHSLFLSWISQIETECKSSKNPMEIHLTLKEVCDYPWHEFQNRGDLLFEKSLDNLQQVIQKIGPHVTKLNIQGFRSDNSHIYTRDEEASRFLSKLGGHFKKLKVLHTRNLPIFDRFVSECNSDIEEIEVIEPWVEELKEILVHNPHVRIKTKFIYYVPHGFQQLKAEYPNRLD